MLQAAETLIIQKTVCMKEVPALQVGSWTFLDHFQSWMMSFIFFQ